VKSLLKTVSCAAVTCVMTVSLWAADGVLIVERTTTAGVARTNQVQIEKNRMRSETTDATGAKQTVIFDAAKQVVYIINMDRKTYTEMTKADIDRLSGQVQGTPAPTAAQLAALPPAQRAQVEAMMRGRGPGAAAAKPEYRKAGTDRVGKWTCDKYEGFQNGQKISEVCTVQPSALGFAEADFAVTRQVADFFKKLVSQNSEQMFSIGRVEDQGFSGVPVKRVFTAAGKESTTELTDVSHQTFADSLFVVPAGFQKQDMLAGRGTKNN
jgi:hypothetical protein